ncbi:unnamed protein product, partial [Rotaria sp. Silwood2]
TIHEELATALGSKAPSYPTVAEWAKRFREGREGVNDDPRSGHEKITSRWVLHQLTDEQKQERVKLCRENLAKFRDGSWRLCDIIIGDETWIYCRQIHRKSTNASWIGEDESPTTIVVEPVVKEIWKQRKSADTKGIKFLQDNARPHIHSDVINYLTEEGIIIMLHPPYSPDLAPCDYWLNNYIKRNLTDQPDEKLLARAVSKVMKKIPKEEFKKTFDKLLERMKLCINNHGDYFEHLIK